RKPSGKARALEKEIGQLEKRMAQLAAEKQKLDARLADPALYQPRGPSELQACRQRQTAVADELAGIETAWLAAQEKLEQ
ncbi:MAG: hypothetical protein B6D47_00745, partial [Rhodocyclaceae bacterium UTPRO2]